MILAGTLESSYLEYRSTPKNPNSYRPAVIHEILGTCLQQAAERQLHWNRKKTNQHWEHQATSLQVGPGVGPGTLNCWGLVGVENL